jgi:hypothetical protein
MLNESCSECMNLGMKVDTDINTDTGMIEQHTSIGQQVIKQLVDTKEEHIKQALVKLGWTPPAVRKQLTFRARSKQCTLNNLSLTPKYTVSDDRQDLILVWGACKTEAKDALASLKDTLLTYTKSKLIFSNSSSFTIEV